MSPPHRPEWPTRHELLGYLALGRQLAEATVIGNHCGALEMARAFLELAHIHTDPGGCPFARMALALEFSQAQRALRERVLEARAKGGDA